MIKNYWNCLSFLTNLFNCNYSFLKKYFELMFQNSRLAFLKKMKTRHESLEEVFFAKLLLILLQTT